MTSIVSFSLYGDRPKYVIGAIRNAESSTVFYPGWRMRFYVGRSVPKSAIARLLQLGSEIVEVPEPEDVSAAFWRFRALADDDAKFVVLRDTDSRFSSRETAAVSEWLDSGRDFHIMRDHPAHNRPMLAGLWGARTEGFRPLRAALASVRPEGQYGDDQVFLYRHVYPLARASAVIHDSFFLREADRRPFPTKREGYSFVGEVFDENDRPRDDDRATLARAEGSRILRAKLVASGLARTLGMWPPGSGRTG